MKNVTPPSTARWTLPWSAFNSSIWSSGKYMARLLRGPRVLRVANEHLTALERHAAIVRQRLQGIPDHLLQVVGERHLRDLLDRGDGLVSAVDLVGDSVDRDVDVGPLLRV